MLSTPIGRTKQERIVACIPQLRRYALALCGNREDADELVQACVERGLSKIKLWRPGSDMRAWLFTIMHNLFVNQCRKQNREQSVFSHTDDPTEPSHTPDLSQGLVMQEIEKQLALLPAEQREVILLVGMQAMSYKQVSTILDVPIGTVMSRLHRARARLRENLFDHQPSHLRRVK